MNRKEIIRMAREAGIVLYSQVESQQVELLERFAQAAYAAGAAAERNKMAAWMIQRSYATGHDDTTEDLLKELEWQVREAERESICKLGKDSRYSHQYVHSFLNTIRARGQA